MTIGEFINRVLAIENDADARRFFEEQVACIQSQIDAGTWESPDDAPTAARADIGWCFWRRHAARAHPDVGPRLR